MTGINTALQAILAHQSAVQIIENNVANANTQGYHKQEAVLSSGIASGDSDIRFGGGTGQYGSGVTIDQIKRYNTDFLDKRYRIEVASTSQWNIQNSVLTQVQSTLNETDTTGSLITSMDSFFSSWQTLSTDPSNTSLRSIVLAQGRTLAQSFNTRTTQLSKILEDQNLSLQQRVDEINSLSTQVASLNGEISKVIAIGNQPNDLIDKRGLAIDRLSELTGATAYFRDNGDANLYIAGHILVFGQQPYSLQFDGSTNTLNWADGNAYLATSGEITGVLNSSEAVKEQMTGLDNLASSMINWVNDIHKTGYGLTGGTTNTGKSFFDGTDASTIRISADIASTDDIAASTNASAPGDGSMAGKLADGLNQPIMGTLTVDQYYNNQISSLGLAIQESANNSKTHDLVAKALDDQRQSTGGVSLDEEAVQLMKSQRAFQAAARLLTVADEMLDKIINGMLP
jgi:flagellar hook-associated protein 1